MVFTKDEKPVNLLNLQNLLTYEDSYKGKMVIFCFQTSGVWHLKSDPRIVISSEARNLSCRPINDACVKAGMSD